MPKFVHPEVSAIPQWPVIPEPTGVVEPCSTVFVYIEKTALEQLKNETVNSESKIENDLSVKQQILPSRNDCLIALIYKAYIETLIENGNLLTQKYPLSFIINARFRRNPPTPKTYVGNMVVLGGCEFTRDQVKKMDLFKIAVEVRKSISKVNEDFVQSFVDNLAQIEFAQLSWMEYFNFNFLFKIKRSRKRRWKVCLKLHLLY